MKKILFAALFFLISTSSTYSHGAGGELTQEKSGYKIDVGYEPKELYANEPANFDFDLLKDGQKVEYTDI